MSSTIPPLVCNTPPPIDFDNDDDDVRSEGIDSTFSPSEDDVSLPATPKHSKTNKKHAKHVSDQDVPSSIQNDKPNDTIASQHGAVSTEQEIIGECKQTDDSITSIEPTLPQGNSFDFEKDVESNQTENISKNNSIQVVIESPPSDGDYDRNDSPPSLELATEKYSDNECDINEVNDEFDDFQRNSNELSVDTISLPSLHFDSIRNSPDFKSDEIDEKKSEPEETNEETPEPIFPDDKDMKPSCELFDAEPPPPPLDVTVECSTTIPIEEIAEINSIADAECDELPSENFAFDADFSQFAAFECESHDNTQQQPAIEPTEQQPPSVKSKSIDNDDDDVDDDFGDFEEARTESKPIESPQDTANDFDDDDFGDFSDFQHEMTSVPAPVHTPIADIPKSFSFDLKSINERFKSILDIAFPTNGDDDGNASTTSSNEIVLSNKIDHFINGTTMHLKNFDNTKALQHQWANSTGKNVLIRALGIDARSIMYGDNWKSPLPRFAANLGYNALEPLKPVAVEMFSNSNNNSTSSKSIESMSACSIEPTIKTERSPEVPDVQFDWQSSGLVNPLDASQAHTLLLDLEQLVVMENLDKIKLDCSSSSSSSTCNATTSSLSTSTNHNLNSTKLRSLLVTVKSSAASIIDSTLPKMQKIKNGQNFDGFLNQTTASFGRSTSNAINGLFNHTKSNHYNNNNVLLVAENAYQMDESIYPYFDISSQEIVHKADTAENQLSRIDIDRKKSIEIDHTSGECGPSEIILSATAPLPKPTTISTTIPKCSAAQPFEMSAVDLAAALNDFEPSQSQSASYAVPGSSGTLKETHIFTPIKLNIATSHAPSQSNTIDATEIIAAPAANAYPEFDFEKISAGVIIDENVVKKEYRDVEYDPDKLKTPASVENDDFSDYQSVEAPVAEAKSTPNNLNTILKPTKTASNISIDWPDPGTVANTNAIEEFKNYVPNANASIKSEQNIDAHVNHSSTNGYEFNKPSIGVSPSDGMFSASNDAVATTNSRDDDFSDFQSTKMAGISYISHVSAIPDIIPSGQSFAYAKSDVAPTSTMPDIFQRVSLASDMGIDKYSEKHSNDMHTVSSPIRSTTSSTLSSIVSPFNSSSILVPQVALQPKQMLTSKHVSSSIVWPEPGISADELARLETIFPQTNKVVNASPIHRKPTNNTNHKTDDDEWSDFVSVTQPQTPITNILNQNLQKHQSNDDDDWSEFVSSAAPPTSIPSTQRHMTNSGPNFTSWNAPTQYNSWQHTPFSQSDNFTLSTMRSNGNGMVTNGHHHTQQQSPSIISLPNLGFVGPNSLVNMPKTNLSKK